jgi:hypothetical protein
MAGRPPPPPLSPRAGELFPPLPLSYRAALAAPPAAIFPATGAPSGFAAPTAAFSHAPGAPPDLAVTPATSSLATGAPPDLAALLAPVSPAAGVLPVPNTPAPLRSAAGTSLHTAASLMTLPYVVSAPAAAAAPPAAPFPSSSAVSTLPRPIAAPGAPTGHAFVITTALPPIAAPTQSATLATAPGPDGSRPAPVLSLPDATLFRSQLLAPGFPHVPLDTPGGAPVRNIPLPTTVYSQPSVITSSLRAPSDDVAAILAATRAAVTAARQRAQDAARALEQEQAVVGAIKRQYAETYRRLADKGVSDGSPTSAHHSADTFEPTPAPASTLRASLHAQVAALTSNRATVTDVLAPDSTQYPRWRDQVLQTLRRYALADHVLSAVPDPSEDWLLMDEVVLSWIHGTLTAELQDIVRVPDDTAHRIWGALEAQFLGHR